MKMKLKLCLFSSFILINAYSAITVSLVDMCTHRPVFVTNPNGVVLSINIKDFDPNKNLTISTEFYPVQKGEKLFDDPRVRRKDYFYSRNDSRFPKLENNDVWLRLPLPSLNAMKYHEISKKIAPLWTVRVSWMQEGYIGHGNVAHLSFFRSDDIREFFQVKSENLCYWEGPAQVSSKMYTNKSNSVLNINREYLDSFAASSMRGFSLGINEWAESSSNSPLIQTPLSFNGNLGWYFKHKGSGFENRTQSSLSRTWSLGPSENAVFISRYSFARKYVERWQWQPPYNGGCGEYRIVDSGILDVGYKSEDLVSLPEDFYASERMNDYINNQRLAVNTCKNGDVQVSGEADDIIINKKTKMYFYRQ